MPEAIEKFLSQPPKSVLIILHGAIGDVARALPLVKRIKKTWPQTSVSWAIEPAAFDLVSENPEINCVHVFKRKDGFPAFVSFINEIRKERYELVLDLQRHFKSGLVSILSGAKYRLGFNRKNSREGNWLLNNYHIPEQIHFSSKSKQYQVFGDKLGLLEYDFNNPWLKCDQERINSLDKLIREENGNSKPSKMCTLLIGSTWESRFWILENYISFVRSLYKNYGIVSILVGSSKKELDVAEEIEKSVDKGVVINLVGKTKLKDLIALFYLVDFAVGVDSGPMHMAAACKLPVISLWGATSPLRSAPMGSETLVLQVPVNCGPCYLEKCPGYNMRCMKLITPEMVLTKVNELQVVFDKKNL